MPSRDQPDPPTHQPPGSWPWLLPGLGLAAAVAAVATVLSAWVGSGLLGYEESPISAILLAVFLGLVVRNTAGLDPRFVPGLEACVRPVLRTGVALLGIRLSLASVAAIGIVAVPLVVGCIVAAFLLVIGLGRWLRLPPRLAWLIAAGTSICGITAIVAVAPVIDADETETSYAVATIALFGMLALFTYPFLAHLLFDDAAHAGLFLGTSIHDTSQVVGAGLAYQSQYAAPVALETAVVTKLVRNLSMVAVIPLIGLLHGRGDGGRDGSSASSEPGGSSGAGGAVVPLFVLGFLAMAVLRTVGDLSDPALGFIPAAVWASGIGWVQAAAEIALILAMAAVGLRTSLRTLTVLGLRPLAAGLAAAAVVGVVSVSLIHMLA